MELVEVIEEKKSMTLCKIAMIMVKKLLEKLD